MPVTKYYKKLKNDLQTFDKYKNYFLLKIDENLEKINNFVYQTFRYIRCEYDNFILNIYVNKSKPAFKNPLKIIYGHFYNGDDMIQYKNYINNTIDSKIHIDDKNIIYSNSLGQPIKYNNVEIIEDLQNKLYNDYMIKNGFDKMYDKDKAKSIKYKYYNNTIVLEENRLKTKFNDNKNTLTIII